jgi:uncharacterized protein (DUF2141 family)
MLKKINLFIAIVLCFLLLTSFKPVAEEGIKLTITSLRNDKGFVLVNLFKEGVGFPDEAGKAFRKDKVVIYNKRAVIIFPELPAGNYAIAILHDENNDQVMNKSRLGLPKEGYGFSNNVMAAFGPPSYKKASFSHSINSLTEVSIRARY